MALHTKQIPMKIMHFKARIIKIVWLKTNYEIACILGECKNDVTHSRMNAFARHESHVLYKGFIYFSCCITFWSLFCKCSYGKLLGKQYSILVEMEKAGGNMASVWKCTTFSFCIQRTRENTIKLLDISTYCLFVRSFAWCKP